MLRWWGPSRQPRSVVHKVDAMSSTPPCAGPSISRTAVRLPHRSSLKQTEHRCRPISGSARRARRARLQLAQFTPAHRTLRSGSRNTRFIEIRPAVISPCSPSMIRRMSVRAQTAQHPTSRPSAGRPGNNWLIDDMAAFEVADPAVRRGRCRKDRSSLVSSLRQRAAYRDVPGSIADHDLLPCRPSVMRGVRMGDSRGWGSVRAGARPDHQ